DIVLQVLDGLFLLGDHGFHQVADGNHAQDFSVFDDGKMAYAIAGHEDHAFVQSVLGGYEEDRTRHDLADGGGGGRFALEDDFACVIALGNNPHQVARGNHQQRADTFGGHFFDSFVNSLFGA